MRIRLFCCLALCAGVFLSFSYGAAPDISRARQLMRDMPVRFEPNRGQWSPRVKFFARAGDSRLLLTAREAEFSAGGHTVSLSLLDSNPSPVIEGLDPLDTRASYFIGSQQSRWRTGVEQYRRVRYSQVYSGIDLIYYGTAGNRLEYDLVLAPGADARQIRLKFRGASRLNITPEGDLSLEAGDAPLVQKKPVIYQETALGSRQPVAGRYKLLGGNTVGVELAAYDHSRSLTIDPTITYSSLVGGGGTDGIIGVKMDKTGMVWVAGYTSTADLVGSDAAFQSASGGGTNIFVAQFNPKGDYTNSLAFFTYIGGSGVDMPHAMAMDASGNIYLAGSTTSTNFPLGGSAFENGLTGGSGTDAFVLKFNPNATGPDQMVYSTYLGGTDVDVAYGIDVDAAGAIYVVGATKSGDFPLTGSAYAGVIYGPQDAFIAKFDLSTSNTLVYSTFLGGELNDEGRAIAVTPSGTVYVAGSTESTGFPQAGQQYQSTLAGYVDGWVAQMDLTKSGVDSLVYSSYIGGNDLDEIRKIAIDSSGRLLVTGYTMSSDFPVTTAAYQKSLGGNADAFVVRLDFTKPQVGFLNYSTYLGGADGETGYDIASDSDGNIYVTGYTLSPDFPVTPGSLPGGGGTDAFLTKLNPALAGAAAKVYSTYVGGVGQHVGYGVAVANDGSMIVGGLTDAQDIFVSANASQVGYAGGLSDGFVIVFGP